MARRSLQQRRVLITGASSGVGRALALELANERPHLMLVARRETALKELAAELETQQVSSVNCVVGDLTQPETRQRVVDHVQNSWGALDVLVNNAGTSSHGRFAASDEETLRGVMETNFFSVAELTRLTLPLLRAGSDAVIVNVGSILGHRGAPYNSEYSASKAALRGWSDALRAELSAEGIDVLMVSPGTIDSEFFEHLLARHEPTPWPKQKGISPKATARQIVSALAKRKREIYPNWRGRLLVTANRWCPGLVDMVMKRFGFGNPGDKRE